MRGADVGTDEGPAALPDRLRHFVLEYLANGWNATAAYAAVFPGRKRTTCASEAWKLLRKPEIVAAIKAEQTELFKRLKMDGLEAMTLISLRARANIAAAYDQAGQLLPVHEWPADFQLCVKSSSRARTALPSRSATGSARRSPPAGAPPRRCVSWRDRTARVGRRIRVGGGSGLES